jgi:REP element-mobilizing transposase RayT
MNKAVAMQQLRVEDPETIYFITTRTMNSRLWFVNNPKLIQKFLGYLAKYQNIYGMILYGIHFMGNHYHLICSFPRNNKRDFMRAFNSVSAHLVSANVDEFEGGKLWGRRHSAEQLPRPEDVEHWWFYLVLNPVSSGLVLRISDFEGYNCFSDAVSGIQRQYEVVNWAAYNDARRFRSDISIADYTERYRLVFTRLPGYEGLSDKEYKKVMHRKLEERRVKIVQERHAAGKGFAGKEALRTVTPGELPRNTKKSARYSKRPIVLTLCDETRKRCVDAYFRVVEWFRSVSSKYLQGDDTVEFPPGTYKPPRFIAYCTDTV